jgi:pentatricopeptide repeat protein
MAGDSFPLFYLAKLTQLDNMNAGVWNIYGVMLERSKRFEEAVESFRKSLAILEASVNSDDRFTLQVVENLARCLCSEGSYEESVEMYERLISTGVAGLHAYVGYGLALFFVDRLEESFAAFQGGLDLMQKNISAEDSQEDFIEIAVPLAQVLYALDTDVHVDLAYQQLADW